MTYSFSRDAVGASEAAHNSVQNNEAFGFRLQNNTIQAQVGGNWQDLTDPNSVRVTTFNVAAAHQTCR